jgi:radical SAM superfamily enzyme YgiQ (UPF0313 family)
MDKIYETYSFSADSINCYGLEVVKNNLRKYDIKFNEFDERSKNPVLFSLYWPQQLYDLVKWRYRIHMKDRKLIIGGNTATTNPDVLMPFCDAIYLGDGECWDGTLNNDYIITKDINDKRNIAISNIITPLNYEDVQSTRRAFCEIARGCKNKCLFCQYGWLKPYREADIKDIDAIVRYSKTKTIRAFSADRFQHSKYIKIREILNKKGATDSGSDISVKFILKHKDYLKYTNKVRVGIEGMSERLRFFIGKRLTDDKIIEFCELVYKAGIKSFDWYMIYGLPTEMADDIVSFKELLKKIDNILPNRYVIAIHWNAFTPSAMTPLQWDKPAYDYNLGSKLNDEIFGLELKNIRIMHKPRLTSNRTILERMIAIRGYRENEKLIYTLSKNKSLFKKHQLEILKYYKQQTGVDLMSELSYDIELPWDRLVNYQRDRMIKKRDSKYAKYGK